MLPGGLFFDTVVLPATGTYSVGIDMKNGVTGTYTLTAYDVPPDINTTLTIGAPAIWVNMATPGQNAELPFSASSGQRVRVQLFNKSLPWVCSWLSIKNPAGSHLVWESCLLPGGTTTLDSPTLTTTGTHSIRIDIPGAGTGSTDVTLTSLSGSLLEELAEDSPVLAVLSVRGAEEQSGELATRSLTDDGGNPPLVAASLQQGATSTATPQGGRPTASPIRTASPTATASATATLATSVTPGPTGQPNALTPTPEPFFGSGTPGPTVRPSPEAPTRLDHRGGPDDEWVPDARNLKGDFTLRRGESRQESPYERFTLPEAGRGETALAGRALKLNGEPLQGVTLRIKDQATTTDEGGRFLLEKLDAGHQVLIIDGSTVNQPGRSYGIFHAGVDIEAGKTNALPYTIWMTTIDAARRQRITSPTTSEVVITSPRLPHLELHIPAGSTVTGADGRLVTEIGLTGIPLDRPPFPVPEGVGFGFPVYFTIQPGGAYVSGPGSYLIYPNYSDETPGTRMNFWHYDPDARGWYVYGMGTVTPDGKQIVPDPGVRIYEFTGAMVASPSLAPADGPVAGAIAVDGDPVDLGTGLLVTSVTDFSLGGLLPFSLSRVYRQNDSRSRVFGIGATHAYEIFLVGDIGPYTYQELILADGGRVRFNRISPGTGAADAVYENPSSPTAFYKAKIAWNGAGWNLTLKDGTVYTFMDGFSASRPQQASLTKITDRNGNVLSLVRDSNSNLTAIRSPSGRWIELIYDTGFRVTQAKDNIGRTVGYQYDASGRLWKVTDPIAGVTEHTYDASHRMLTIKDPKNIVF